MFFLFSAPRGSAFLITPWEPLRCLVLYVFWLARPNYVSCHCLALLARYCYPRLACCFLTSPRSDFGPSAYRFIPLRALLSHFCSPVFFFSASTLIELWGLPSSASPASPPPVFRSFCLPAVPLVSFSCALLPLGAFFSVQLLFFPSQLSRPFRRASLRIVLAT